MAEIEISTATLESILTAARESEVGVAIRADNLKTIQSKLYFLEAAKEFTLVVMNNPLELWVVPKGLDLEEERVIRRS